MSLQKINEKFSKKKFQNRKNFRNLIMSKKIKFKNIFIIVYLLLTIIIINNVYAKKNVYIYAIENIICDKKKIEK